ncbi:hypothetical protein F4679DRAFT_380426 [Xylaria curta]|nr:hypothetical protein F4679DRAFT_380426 [Xylaria curta]
MAAPIDRPYRHLGALLPFYSLEADNEWSYDEDIERGGFVYVKKLKKRIFVMHSITTGDVLVNKILKAHPRDYEIGWRPEEFRLATAPQADRVLPRSCIVDNRTRLYFIELELWQDLDHETISLYLRHYNGGSLWDLLCSYIRRNKEVPEHFVWHVLLTLIEAVRYLKFGALPGTDDEDPNWIPIHHRDIATRNVFVHYLPREGPEPDEGFEENAFPELILGDFGHGAVDDETERRIKCGCWGRAGEIAEWHDTYAIFSTAKQLCTQIYEFEGTMAYVNENVHDGEPPYSDDLIRMIQNFEWPNYENSDDVTASQRDPATGLMVPNYSYVPTMRRVVDEFLPYIREKVRRYRNPKGGIPDGWWKQLDVSWTQPDPFMPYEWMTQGLPNPNDTKNQGGKILKKDKDKGENDGENVAPNKESDSDSETDSQTDSTSDPESDSDSNSDEEPEEGPEEKPEEKPKEKVHRAHRCPKPNPKSIRRKLKWINQLANDYPARPLHHIVQLEYGQPVMTEIRRPPRWLQWGGP